MYKYNNLIKRILKYSAFNILIFMVVFILCRLFQIDDLGIVNTIFFFISVELGIIAGVCFNTFALEPYKAKAILAIVIPIITCFIIVLLSNRTNISALVQVLYFVIFPFDLSLVCFE